MSQKEIHLKELGKENKQLRMENDIFVKGRRSYGTRKIKRELAKSKLILSRRKNLSIG